MFRLEALQARHGDCLILRWNDGVDRLALIDGGPDQTYSGVLSDRLRDIASERVGESLPIDLLMVSHIDDDHIHGVLDLVDDIDSGDSPVEVRRIWHNSLEHLLDQSFGPNVAGVGAALEHCFPKMADAQAQAVLASVPQGQALHGFAKRRGLLDTMNRPYAPLVALAEPPQEPQMLLGLKLEVVCPELAEVERLRAAWKRHQKEDVAASYGDRSPYNLSSIVVLIEFEGRRMLLTGDGRGDLILAGLAKRRLLVDGRFHADLLKIPHHGSRNNLTPAFFEAVTADVYVVSGDHVRFQNPDETAMRWLKDARGDAAYEVLCTYDLPHMRRIFGDRLRFPAAGTNYVHVELSG